MEGMCGKQRISSLIRGYVQTNICFSAGTALCAGIWNYGEIPIIRINCFVHCNGCSNCVLLLFMQRNWSKENQYFGRYYCPSVYVRKWEIIYSSHQLVLRILRVLSCGIIIYDWSSWTNQKKYTKAFSIKICLFHICCLTGNGWNQDDRTFIFTDPDYFCRGSKKSEVCRKYRMQKNWVLIIHFQYHRDLYWKVVSPQRGNF